MGKSGKKWLKVEKIVLFLHLKILCGMLTFIGEFIQKIDSKGRLVFPAALKKQLKPATQEHFVIKEDLFEQCLVLYPMEEWERQNAILRKKLNPFNAKHNRFLRGFAKGAAEVALDANSRLLIPRRLVDYAEIDKEVILAGQNGKIEIWSKDRYNAIFSEEIDYAALADEVLGGSLNPEE